MQPNIIPLQKKGHVMTRDALERELTHLQEQLKPFYEDDDEALKADIAEQMQREIGTVGLMSAIAWCHGQIGLYKLLNDESK